MNITPFRAVALGAAVVALTASSFAQIWNFDAGAQGWQVYDANGGGNYTHIGTYAVTWHNAGGNPDGFISGLDPSGGSFMFQAPVSNSNFGAFAGGQLQFSLQTNFAADYADDSVIVFRGGASNLTLVAPLGYQPVVPPRGLAWTDYSINLLAGTFRYNNLSGGVVNAADFAAVLGDLDVFLINGEFHNGIEETSGLDSVRFLAAGNGAVPEPSTYGLFGAGALAGLVAWRRRRQAANRSI